MESRVLVLLALCFLCTRCWCSERRCAVSIVVAGSTGDLARRYLWPAIFQHYLNSECGISSNFSTRSSASAAKGCGLVIAGHSRRAVTDNATEWWQHLLSNVHCQSLSCELCQQKFIRTSIRLAPSGDDREGFASLSSLLSDIYEELKYVEIGRVFHLSIPSSAYLSVAHSIHIHGRPTTNGSWLRVALEKPFGMDLASAQLLNRRLMGYFKEEEVYRVDHYLGKWGVRNILPFRLENAGYLERLWNKDHVDYIEVCVKERLDIEGRSSFFDQFGIIRDMHQNHLMEILARVMLDTSVLMDDNVVEEKVKFLSSLHPPSLDEGILGQYQGYHNHLAGDGISNLNSSTPTFATVALYSFHKSWTRVPLLLTAGKQLNERKAFARVVFRQRTFSLAQKENFCPVEIIFLIQDEEFGVPGVLLSYDFADISFSNGSGEILGVTVQRGGCPYMLLHQREDTHTNAYVSVVSDILAGTADNFVDIASLLQSWDVWDPLLATMKDLNKTRLLKYSPDNMAALDFRIENMRLIALMNDNRVVPREPCFENDGLIIRGFRSVVSHKQHLFNCLAQQIRKQADLVVRGAGSFHIALPGGRSLVPLLKELLLKYSQVFPWKHTHIWQTDERCVPLNHSHSNWNQLQDVLLSHVPIPYHHLHPMPVHLYNGSCISADNGCDVYEGQLIDHVGMGGVDHVVLGVGLDGHIASIFPNSASRKVHASKLGQVMLVEHDYLASVNVGRRMSLSLDQLASAKSISVVVVGEGKEEVVEALMRQDDVETHPMVVVLIQLLEHVSNKSQVHFYIDKHLVH